MICNFFKIVILLPNLVFAQGNTNPPAMPIPPGFGNAALSQPGSQPVPPNGPAAAVQGSEQLPAPKPAAPALPEDFELIQIKPYFKNKTRLGKITVTVHSAGNDLLGRITGDFGDCKTCLRGASIKGKIGVRVYGQSLTALTVSRKNSSSISAPACPTGRPLMNMTYVCDFASAGTQMKMTVKVEP